MGDKPTVTRTFRLTDSIDARLRTFCLRTSRHEAHTLRSIVELFFQDGDDVAEMRLSSRLWSIDAPRAAALQTALLAALRAVNSASIVEPPPPRSAPRSQK